MVGADVPWRGGKEREVIREIPVLCRRLQSEEERRRGVRVSANTPPFWQRHSVAVVYTGSTCMGAYRRGRIRWRGGRSGRRKGTSGIAKFHAEDDDCNSRRHHCQAENEDDQE